ncbi:MAG: PAS domain S-box protein, partial [Pseudomonadota bacterium]
MSGVGNDSLAGSSGHYLQREFHDLLSSDRGVLEFLSAGCLDGIWYWDLLQPEHEWMSRSFWETLGYDPLDKPHLSSAWQDIINPDDLQLALENAKRHFEDPAHPYDQIVRYRHTEGHTVWIRCRGLAVRDAQGQPRRMLGAHTDVTELKRAEEELRLRTQELDLILEHMPARIWLKDDANKIIRCNRAAAISMGFEDEEQLRGSDTYELFPAMAQKYHDDDLAVLDSGQARLNIEERYTPRDGASAWISTDKVPVETERGERRLLVMSTDVTERIAREQRLSQLN